MKQCILLINKIIVRFSFYLHTTKKKRKTNFYALSLTTSYRLVKQQNRQKATKKKKTMASNYSVLVLFFFSSAFLLFQLFCCVQSNDLWCLLFAKLYRIGILTVFYYHSFSFTRFITLAKQLLQFTEVTKSCRNDCHKKQKFMHFCAYFPLIVQTKVNESMVWILCICSV